jgi:glycosidase
MNQKIIIYQVFARLFGNRTVLPIENGTIAENGCGKMLDFDTATLKRIKDMGISHIWYTGVIRHATTTDYSKYGIPLNNPNVVKGNAGSPYAITDYYDIDPDIAVDIDNRMGEFEDLLLRTHEVGMNVIIDFVPNHVAREYHSIKKPEGIRDLGEDDDVNKGFDNQNNFYYCPDQKFNPKFDITKGEPYVEIPAKATGNDCFGSTPSINDWYETVKLNYGVDYCDPCGRSYHFSPIPSTWNKMLDILLFWASKGIDGFRCDMAEMVPFEFWSWAICKVKMKYPNILFIGEVYDNNQYGHYVHCGFDFLYDKVCMYDTLRSVICGNSSASSITRQWQITDDYKKNMLYFLENHDEQRIASNFFAGNGNKGVPGLIVSALMNKNPFMLYAGQEYGERGMDKEGFSGLDGRTSIFDYWTIKSLNHAFYNSEDMSTSEKELSSIYSNILNLARNEDAIGKGDFFDLMYVNPKSDSFNPQYNYAFLRKYNDEMLLVITNFSGSATQCKVIIPAHAFDCFGMTEQTVEAVDLLSGEKQNAKLLRDKTFDTNVLSYSGRIFKFNLKMKENTYVLNEHNKDEFPPAHTAEHLLNQTMYRFYGCERSKNAHIERKKSKISYLIDHKPSRKEEKAIEDKMNELIDEDLLVTFEFVDREHLPVGVSIDKLPENASETLRIVRIGDYDVCPCVGKHVRSTKQIGRFVILGTNWDENTHTFRIRFKVVN